MKERSSFHSVSRLAKGAVIATVAASMQVAVSQAQTCVTIDGVDLTGVSLIDQSALQAEFSDHLGCIGLAELNGFLESVTLAYIDAGYVASRAYLPEQDLSDGSLTIAVIEGQVSDVATVTNGSPSSSRSITAFPGMEDEPLQLRDLEQGIAQINRLPSSDAVSELVPGAEPGDSLVLVEITEGRPWRLSFSADNRGTPSTGESNFGATFGYDNLLGLNDQWTFTYQRSMEPSPLAFGTDTPVGNSYSLSASVPYGYWTYALALSASDYSIEIPGITRPIESSGQSQRVRVSAERLLSISEAGRWDAGMALRWTDNENQILGARIDTSSRRMTILDTYLRRSQSILGGQLDATLTLRTGLDGLGAFDDDTAPPGSPVAQYSAWLIDASFQRPWQIGEQVLVLSSRLSGQHSDDDLFGSEQFSSGGFGTVRGARTSVLFGNRGLQSINTLTMPQAISLNEHATVTPYFGLDAGHVFQQRGLGIEGGSLTSYTIGFTVADSRLSIDAAYSEILSAPSALQLDDEGFFTLRASLTF